MYGYFIYVPRKRVIDVAKVWPDINISKSKVGNSDFYDLQRSKCAIIKKKCNIIVLWWKFVVKSCDSPFNLKFVVFFVLNVTLLCEPNCNADGLSSILHLRLYVPVDFIYDIFFFRYCSIFFRNLFSIENHLRNHVIDVTRKIPWKSGGVSKVFLGWSFLVVLHTYRTILSNDVCHLFNSSWNYYR